MTDRLEALVDLFEDSGHDSLDRDNSRAALIAYVEALEAERDGLERKNEELRTDNKMLTNALIRIEEGEGDPKRVAKAVLDHPASRYLYG